MPSGGRRRGAGRPAKPLKVARKVLAEEILGAVDEKALWGSLLASENERIRLDALKYLVNRRDGLPAQSVQTWRDSDIFAFDNFYGGHEPEDG